MIVSRTCELAQNVVGDKFSIILFSLLIAKNCAINIIEREREKRNKNFITFKEIYIYRPLNINRM